LNRYSRNGDISYPTLNLLKFAYPTFGGRNGIKPQHLVVCQGFFERGTEIFSYE